MQITGVSPNQMRELVDYVSGAYYGYNITVDTLSDLHGKRAPRIRVSLRVATARAEVVGGTKGECAPGARRSRYSDGRRVAALCWHGYRDVLKELFTRYPNAIVRTAVATYSGTDDFYAKFPATGDNNIGSVFAPFSYRNACDCIN